MTKQNIKEKKKWEKIFKLGDQIGKRIIADYLNNATKTKTSSNTSKTKWIVL